MQQTTASKQNASKVAPPVAKDKTKTNTKVEIDSRFGKIEVKESNCIVFKHGLLGIPAAVTFCLTELPNNNTGQFKLLQSLEDEGLSFIVVPSQYDNQLIEKKDLDDACKILSIETKNLIVLFIVSVSEEGSQRTVSVNAKAPILIDATTKIANQYVLQNDAYKIQHVIS